MSEFSTAKLENKWKKWESYAVSVVQLNPHQVQKINRTKLKITRLTIKLDKN